MWFFRLMYEVCVKKYLSVFLPIWTHIINLSLSTGSLDNLKHATITPLLKNADLDFNKYENFCPVSNLTFISKLTEKVVLKRLSNHMHHNNLNIPHQHGYKKNHNTETVLLKLINDIRINFDKSNATVLFLLDWSAAFDTVSVYWLVSTGYLLNKGSYTKFVLLLINVCIIPHLLTYLHFYTLPRINVPDLSNF